MTKIQQPFRAPFRTGVNGGFFEMTLYPRLIDDNDHDHRPPILSVIYECNLCPFETKGSKISNEDNSALWAMQDHVKNYHHETVRQVSYSIIINRMDPKAVRR